MRWPDNPVHGNKENQTDNSQTNLTKRLHSNNLKT